MKITQKASRLLLSPLGGANKITALAKASAVVMVLLLVACATAAPVPTLALQGAETAIDNADQARVSDYALPELREARQKLTSARAAVQAKDMVLARNLADESRISAELASAKAEQIKASQINEDMKKSIRTLNLEMQRNSGEQR